MTKELDVDRTARDPDNALRNALSPEPIGLSRAEINAAADPIKPGPLEGIPAQVWLHFLTADGVRAARLDCRVKAYDTRAVQVEGRIGSLPWGPVWVWASSVSRRRT